VRIYEQIFGWYAGLDSFAPEFTTYWMTILYIEEPVELISFLALVAGCGRPATRMWRTSSRARNAPDFQPIELDSDLRCCDLLGASYFTEQDGTWHMTVIRDTDFTPSHIIESI